MSYFAKVRAALQEGRARSLTFDQAWSRMLRTLGRPRMCDDITASTLEFAKGAFREGYYRRQVLGGASILAETDGWSGDHRVDGHSSANALVVA